VIGINGVPGVVAGTYRVARTGDAAELSLQPLKAWQPPILKGAPWVSTYRYEARIDLSAAAPTLASAWTRASDR
jgi:hypothetical protein